MNIRKIRENTYINTDELLAYLDELLKDYYGMEEVSGIKIVREEIEKALEKQKYKKDHYDEYRKDYQHEYYLKKTKIKRQMKKGQKNERI